RDDSKEMIVFIEDHHIRGCLKDLLGIGRQDDSGKSHWQTEGLRIVMRQIPGPWLIENFLSTRPEQVRVELWIISCDPGRIRVARTDLVAECGPRPHSGKVRFPIWHAPDGTRACGRRLGTRWRR